MRAQIHWLQILVLVSGCQAYTIPSRTTQVTVQTIALPPQWAGMEADLTRELVQQLRLVGYDARWATTSADTAPKQLRCTVDLKATHMPQSLIMDALLLCDLGDTTVEQRGQSSAFSEDSRAAFDAGKDAIDRALPQIDLFLQGAP